MVDDRLTDGRRIAELLASELDGLGDELAAVAVGDADRDAAATPEGAYAYRVTLHGGGSTEDADDTDDADDSPGVRELAVVFVQPNRARVEFVAAQDVAAATGDAEGLRVRPKAVRPPRTLVFVEDGAAVKRAVAVFEAVVAAVGDAERRG
ncbi:hypothetical protein [Salinigranum marinum]|uniref:hypothetical protein n=1 Tax=Salinigranum marinum TaxID=1515595 RepID=UPI002989B7BF|nr:hypothetical protein [Salinigranum marinum]